MKLKILYDNLAPPPDIIANNSSYKTISGHHGFSALIDIGDKKILFDTGWNGLELLRNCETLNINLNEIDALFISHAHWDHAGGIAVLLDHFNIPQIYLPNGYSINQIKEMQYFSDEVYIQRIENFTVLDKISNNLASTGTLKGKVIDEQYLLIKYGKEDSEKSNCLLLSGCAHAGLKAPLRISEKKIGRVDTICGGIHGFNDQNLLEKFANLGLKRMFIGHCTKNYSIIENVPDIELKRLYTGFEFEF